MKHGPRDRATRHAVHQRLVSFFEENL